MIDGTWRPPVTGWFGPRSQEVLKAAFELLKSAGFRVQDGKMLDPQGKPRLRDPDLIGDEERLAAIYQRTLEKIGIDVGIRALDGDQIQSRQAALRLRGADRHQRPSATPCRPAASNSAAGDRSQLKQKGRSSRRRRRSRDRRRDRRDAERSYQGRLCRCRPCARPASISGNYIVPMQYNTQQWLAYWSYLEHPQRPPIFGYQLPTWRRKPN
ncbi:hypothetical protein ACVOMV_36595 [Mesorhizobium atlanticum]